MSDFGELRAWLAAPSHTGTGLHELLVAWQDTEQLAREVLPYLSEQVRRLDVRVAPTNGVPYSAWFDVWLERAMQLDEQGDVSGALATYQDCLRIKPDCIPARVNHFRLAHRGVPFKQVLATHAWEAHGPYGDESWEALRDAVSVMDEVSADLFVRKLDALWDHVEHQGTLYPSTLALAYFLMCVLDRQGDASLDVTSREAIFTWLSTIAGWVLRAFLIRSDGEQGVPGEMLAALDKLPGCMDLVIATISFNEERVWWEAHRRQSVWFRDESFEGYEEYERCELPCFPNEVFVRESLIASAPQNTIYDGLHGVLYQVIAAGLPMYRRIQRLYPGEADWLMLLGGHFAEVEREEVLKRLGRPRVLEMMASAQLRW